MSDDDPEHTKTDDAHGTDEQAISATDQDDPDGAPDMHTDEPTERRGDEAEPAADPNSSGNGSRGSDGSGDGGDGSRDLVRYARYALLGGLTLLALVATLRFYFAVSNTIDLWVAREYRSLFQAAFNLVVLLLAAIGISWEVRKVSG